MPAQSCWVAHTVVGLLFDSSPLSLQAYSYVSAQHLSVSGKSLVHGFPSPALGDMFVSLAAQLTPALQCTPALCQLLVFPFLFQAALCPEGVLVSLCQCAVPGAALRCHHNSCYRRGELTFPSLDPLICPPIFQHHWVLVRPFM